MSNKDNILQDLDIIHGKREELYQELKDRLDGCKADNLKYWEVLSDFRGIIEDLEAIRERELDLISQKIALESK